MRHRLSRQVWAILATVLALAAVAFTAQARVDTANLDQSYEYADTRQVVALVDQAADLVATRGEAAFADFRVPGSPWRQDDRYIFVLDPTGEMVVHPDPSMEGSNQLALRDVSGKPIIQGLIDTVTALPDKTTGWYHYQWPVPGEFLPRWKSSYVELVTAPSGERYVVGSGVYNDRMERAFVVDAVTEAAGLIEKRAEAAFPLFRSPESRFVAKDAYIFVFDPKGVELVNPAFPNLEGRNLLDLQDTEGTPIVRQMLDVVKTEGSGWVDYMWPKPGDNVSTQKSTYVRKAKLGSSWVLVGSGVYLADAPKATRTMTQLTAPELMTLVREAADVFAARGERAYDDFRVKGSKWFQDDTYFFVWTLDGKRIFHAANPTTEGQNVLAMKDTLGRPLGEMILEAATSPSHEGWVHYMYPEPGDIFPTWKSTFVKATTFPSGQRVVVGSGIYNMKMDRAFIEDVVDRAANLVAAKGSVAFDELRDKRGPFVFMDTYVFVARPDGVEVVNAGQPSLEGTNMLGLTDLHGKPVMNEILDVALREGDGWLDYYWYKPGDNTEARKETYVRKVRFGDQTFVVGSGYYLDDEASSTS